MNTQNMMRVVLIDDYDMTRTLLRIILRGKQFEIVGEASDGQEGINLCQQLKPDLILLDVVMPKMDGLSALEKIRKLLPESVILMVTSNEDQEIVNQSIEKGADGYIIKPFNTASVLLTLNQVQEKFTLQRSAKVQR